jgi:TIR domain
MQSSIANSIRIFYCYAPEDKMLQKKLEEHLSPLQRSYHITTWSNHEIKAGSNWASEIEANLNAADIILLLVSSSFLASDLCYTLQIQQALERHEAGVSKVIPIILRPALWRETPLGKLQSLPRDNRPITQWRNRDAAFLDVAINIWVIIKDMFIENERQRQINERRKYLAEQRELIEEDGRIHGKEWIAQRRTWLDGQESLVEQRVEEWIQDWIRSGRRIVSYSHNVVDKEIRVSRQIEEIKRDLLIKVEKIAEEYAKVNHEGEDHEQLQLHAWHAELLGIKITRIEPQ